MKSPISLPSRVRVVAGIPVSLVLITIVLTRVDLAQVGRALVSANPALVALAIAIGLLDQVVRAARWRRLLAPLRTVDFLHAFGLQAIGFLGNAILPARMGDFARAFLAASYFQTPRMAMLATILAERVLDGVAMLGLALTSSLMVQRAAAVRDLAGYGIAVVYVGAFALAIAWRGLSRGRLSRMRGGELARSFGARLGAGLMAFRSPGQGSRVILITLVAELIGATLVYVVVHSVGIALSPVEAILLTAGLGLSLAIPAAPGAWGTYELAGLAILTTLGESASTSLAAILLIRATITVPAAILGAASLVAFGVKLRSLMRAAPKAD